MSMDEQAIGQVVRDVRLRIDAGHEPVRPASPDLHKFEHGDWTPIAEEVCPVNLITWTTRAHSVIISLMLEI